MINDHELLISWSMRSDTVDEITGLNPISATIYSASFSVDGVSDSSFDGRTKSFIENITLQGSFSHNWPIWERVLALLTSGQLNVKPIIGGVWPITDWHTAFEKMHKGEVVKSVLKPV